MTRPMIAAITSFIIAVVAAVPGCPQDGRADGDAGIHLPADVVVVPLISPDPGAESLVEQCQHTWDRQDQALESMEAAVDGLEAMQEGPPHE